MVVGQFYITYYKIVNKLQNSKLQIKNYSNSFKVVMKLTKDYRINKLINHNN